MSGTGQNREMHSRAERREKGRSLRKQVPHSSHGDWLPAADRPDPVNLLQAQDRSRIKRLLPIKYGRMLESPFTFLLAWVGRGHGGGNWGLGGAFLSKADQHHTVKSIYTENRMRSTLLRSCHSLAQPAKYGRTLPAKYGRTSYSKYGSTSLRRGEIFQVGLQGLWRKDFSP